MKQVPTVPQLNLPYRDERVVDLILGRKRKSILDNETVDFSECQLAKEFPNIADYLEEMYMQRQRQKAGGPLAHPRAIRTMYVKSRAIVGKDPAPWEDGPSVGDVNRAYKTTDRGR